MTKGIIATPHRLAGEAGAQVLRDGGNAIDVKLIFANVEKILDLPSLSHKTNLATDHPDVTDKKNTNLCRSVPIGGCNFLFF